MANRKKRGRQQKGGRPRSERQMREGPKPTQALFLAQAKKQLDQLVRQGQREEARATMEALYRHYWENPSFVAHLAQAARKLGDWALVERYLLAVAELPPSAGVAAELVDAHLRNSHPGLALARIQRFLAAYPEDSRADQLEQIAAQLEEEIQRAVDELDFQVDEPLTLTAENERMTLYMLGGEEKKALALARELIDRYPAFVPARNNLAQLYFLQGDLGRAIQTSRDALEMAPQNFHASANLARYLLLEGKEDAARPIVTQLLALPAASPEIWLKRAEVLTLLGDDEALIANFAAAGEDVERMGAGDTAMLQHLTAVAEMRTGNQAAAVKLWQASQRVFAGLELAARNLADLAKPVAIRHAPWAFTLRYWGMSQEHVGEFGELVASVPAADEEAGLRRVTRRFLNRYPQFRHLVPKMLARGDEMARTVAMHFATLAQEPDLLAALAGFAQSQDGPDAMRLQAAETARAAGLLPGQVRLWLQGAWQSPILLSFEIVADADPDYTTSQRELVAAAGQAYAEGRSPEAVPILEQLVTERPDDPSLHMSLLQVYLALERHEPAEHMVAHLRQRFPEQIYGDVGQAQVHISRLELDEAKRLLEAQFNRAALLAGEFSTLAQTQVMLLILLERYEAALSWLDMWASAEVHADAPQITALRQRVQEQMNAR